MEAEKRGKYAGVKLHLDETESQKLLDWNVKRKAGKVIAETISEEAIEFCKQVAKAIKKLQKEYPDLLKDRTPEEVKAALEKDQAKIVKQLGKMAIGGDWKQVK